MGAPIAHTSEPDRAVYDPAEGLMHFSITSGPASEGYAISKSALAAQEDDALGSTCPRAHVEPIDLRIVVEQSVELWQVELARIALGEGLRACHRKRPSAVDMCLVSELDRYLNNLLVGLK